MKNSRDLKDVFIQKCASPCYKMKDLLHNYASVQLVIKWIFTILSMILFTISLNDAILKIHVADRNPKDKMEGKTDE